jgi:hypothetical protein
MDNETPALSPSIAHQLVTESPRHAWLYHRLLGGYKKPPTDEQEYGRLMHALILGEREKIVVVQADSFRGKAERAERDAARAAGKIPVVERKYQAAVEIAEVLKASIAELGYDLSAGTPEMRVEWEVRAEAGRLQCSGYLDWLRNDRLQVLDLKTTDGSCHPDACAMKLVKQGGCIQDAAYRQAVETLNPEVAGRIEIVFLFCQLAQPFAVTPIICGGSMRELGESRWTRACDLFSRYLALGREAKHWPPYADRPVIVEAPGWLVQREIMEDW